ncbi:glycosyltransferase [Sulfobacillus thermosulfidooxidans]|uniref:glycosyltransferase n=1 Tax=Sulfobacillus thermosulfidooxidans TaxID=28034 RepID=UPI00096B8545|nr:glycosyltransferase [Sulfobacillus thermosulfidooxidans]OLZ11201.1 hypothetical protein BFX05_07935 [Sulfobacillus thermosulfidooxidans]OLZ13460.1 hypothetical protein BFX06_09830 [Sulfobacillus thermosulfidooxidans]OLZ21707.1 hypothetical protein BFX07_12880 [Sulfobacillus thermosulfidooxidans]
MTNNTLWTFWMLFILFVISIALYSWRHPQRQWPYTTLYFVSLGVTLVYAFWRIDRTIDFHSIPDAVASFLLFAAEFVGMFQFAVFGIFMHKRYRRPIPSWPPAEPLPSVDIFIATYNEDRKILEKSLAACKRIQYPHRLLTVYICDDGNRPEIRDLATKWHVQYLARPTHDHAKAGNLNYALAHSNGDLILTLDADMIPKPIIVQDMIGYFTDPTMGFVQAPQVFYNPDPYQHNLPFGHLRNNDQDYFMREMLPRRDRFQAVMYIGSNAMFSRKALAHIGGFVTGSITEDLATGLVLQAEHFRSAYCDAVVATGLSPETFSDLVRQRERWCRGNIQVFRQHNILTPYGLSFWQRIAYISGALYWYFGVQKLIFVIVPLLFIFFGVVALHTMFITLIFMWIPYFLAQVLTYKRLAERKNNIWWSHVQELALMPFLAFAAIAETFNLSVNHFRVTNKGVVTNKAHTTHHFWILATFAAIALVGLIDGLRVWHADTAVMARNSLEISLAWDTFNLLGLIFATIGSYERARPRASERRLFHQNVQLIIGSTLYNVTLKDISESGFRISAPESTGSFLHDGQLLFHGFSFPIKISGVRRLPRQKNPDWIGQFYHLTADAYEHLVYLIYGYPETAQCPDLGTIVKRRSFPGTTTIIPDPSLSDGALTSGEAT